MTRRALSMLLPIGLALTSCAVDTVERPLPVQVSLRLDDSLEVPRAGALRLAALWRLSDGLYVAADQPVEVPLGEEVEVDLIIPSPPDSVVKRASPLDAINLNTTEDPRQEVLTRAHRLWLAVYEDVDANERLTLPTQVPTEGADRVLALDRTAGPGVAALVDLDEWLASLSLEQTERYYAQTGQRYTRYTGFRAANGSTILSGQPLPGVVDPVTLTLGDSPRLTAQTTCRDRGVPIEGGQTRMRVIYDEAVRATLPGDLLCPGTPPERVTCTSEVLEHLATPTQMRAETTPLDTGPTRRGLICRTDGLYSAVEIRTTRLTCSGCLCTLDADRLFYVAFRTTLPRWWPCDEFQGPPVSDDPPPTEDTCTRGVVTPWLSGCD